MIQPAELIQPARMTALDKPIKKYIQEQQSKKTRTKTRWDARLACLANFSTEGREEARKVLKRANMPLAFFDDNEFYQARKCLKARSKRRKTNQTQVKRGKHYEKYLH